MDFSEDHDALSLVLGHFAKGQFFEEYWERKPLYLKGGIARKFTQLLSAKKLDHLIQYGSIKPPHFRMFRNGAAISDAHFMYTHTRGRDKEEDAARVSEIYRQLNEKSSLAVQFMEKIDKEIATFCAAFSSSIGSRVQANSYLTFPGTQTLNHHYDMHDVFVLQAEGQKDWVIWDDPIYLAMRKPDHLQLRQSSQRRVASSKVLFEGTLHPGDVLYIPRGYVHAAKATSHHSLHLTVGVLVRRLHSLLETAFDGLMTEIEKNLYMRESAFHGGGTVLQDISSFVAEHLTTDCVEASIDRAIQEAKATSV